MENTSDSSEESKNIPGNFGYVLGLSLGVLVIFVIITIVSYIYTRVNVGRTLFNPSSIGPRTSIDTTSTDYDSSRITIQENGLDEATLSSYPHFAYSQLKTTKSGSTEASTCSICLVECKNDDDLLRLLPDCGHFFHLKCIDSWLMLHPTCPICRNFPFSTPLAPVATN